MAGVCQTGRRVIHSRTVTLRGTGVSPVSPIMDISQSIHEILSRDDVVADLFYDIFLDRYPEVRKYFVGVDIRQQAVVLTMMLSVIEDYYRHAYPATTRYLRLLGQRHKAREIPRELYPKFSQCLLETLQRFHGKNWNPRLAEQWQDGIAATSRVLLEGYEPATATDSVI